MGDGDSGRTSISGLKLQEGQPPEELRGLPIVFGLEFLKVLADEEVALSQNSVMDMEFIVGLIRVVPLVRKKLEQVDELVVINFVVFSQN